MTLEQLRKLEEKARAGRQTKKKREPAMCGPHGYPPDPPLVTARTVGQILNVNKLKELKESL